MKGLMNLRNTFTSVVLLTFFLSLVSCGDDGGKGPGNSSDAIKGNYKGKMTTLAIVPQDRNSEIEGVNVTAKVDNEYISFDDFPIKDIVVSVVGEENADEILKLVGKVSYKIIYKATINETKEKISFALNPEPLHLEFTIPGNDGDEGKKMVINVEVSAPENGNYDIKTTDLNFNFAATKVLIDDVELPGFNPTSFHFYMKKAK